MDVKLYKGDIAKADALMALFDGCPTVKHFQISEIVLEQLQKERILTVLENYGYISIPNELCIKATDITALYRSNGGLKAIYDAQQRECKMQEWKYSNMKWTNIRSWIAIAVSVVSTIVAIISLFY